MKKVRVAVEYIWEFSEKDWDSQQQHIKSLKDDINVKISYDPISAFHHLNDITYPECKYEVKRINK